MFENHQELSLSW